MKLKILIILLILVGLNRWLYSEKKYTHYFVPKGNLSSNYYAFSDLDHTKRATGFSVGFLYDFWFTDDLSLSSEVLYLKKVYDLPYIRYHYLCFDLLFKISSSRRIYGEIGFGLDILLNKNENFETIKIAPVSVVFIIGGGFYLNLWEQDVFLMGGVRVRVTLDRINLKVWGKRHIATTSIEFGLAFPLVQKR